MFEEAVRYEDIKVGTILQGRLTGNLYRATEKISQYADVKCKAVIEKMGESMLSNRIGYPEEICSLSLYELVPEVEHIFLLCSSNFKKSFIYKLCRIGE